jgi:transketolase
VNGHDVQQIESALQPSSKLAPKAVIAHTVKGKGCEVMENNPAWHHKAPNPDELETLIASLK